MNINGLRWARHDAREGTPAGSLAREVADGRLERVRRGVYAPADGADEYVRHRRLVDSTWPLLAQGSVISHVSAASLLGLPLPRGSLHHVTVSRAGGGRGRIGSHVHLYQCRVFPEDVTERDGFLITTPERTAIDVARHLPFEWGVAICDAVLHGGGSFAEMESVVRRSRSSPGVRKATAALRFADGRAESPAESLSRVTMDRLGLPAPDLQVEVWHEGRFLGRSDFGWDELRLLGEVDGAVKYGALLKPGQTPQEVILAEKRREGSFVDAGYMVVRWGWAEANDRAALGVRLGRAMEAARR